MSASHRVTEKRAEPPAKGEMDTELRGYKLALARAAWIIIVILAEAIAVAELPQSYAYYLMVCTQAQCQNQQATPGLVRSLHAAGLSLQFYAIYLTTLSVVIALIFFIIGGIIAWRKSRDWMGLLVSLTLIIVGTVTFSSNGYSQVEATYHLTQVPGDLLTVLLGILPFLVGYLFPDGRFVPRWTRWMALLIVLFVVGSTLFPSSPFNTDNWPNPLGTVIQFVPIVTVLFAQVYRYLRVSSPVQRQQTKWVLFGIITTIIYLVGLSILTAFYPTATQADLLGSLFAEASYFVAFIILPLALALSILRYRLWEIDLLINRTLVYVSLTAILGLIYFGCVVLLQRLVNGLTGKAGQSPVVIVISTLAIAALFQPLRRRIQSIIDRRFYRRKYDAGRTLAAFSATLRNEVDLSELHGHLIAVVQETMQPTHVSLWLRPSDSRAKQSAASESNRQDQ